MREAPLALHLTSFSGRSASAPVPTLTVVPPVAEATVTLTVSELEKRLAKAARDSEAAAMAECERRLLAAEQEHQTESAAALANARASWVAEQAAQLAPQLDTGLGVLRAELSAQIANVLRHLLTDSLVTRALTLFDNALEQLLSDARHPPIVVRGPADLLAALENARAADGRVSFEVAPLTELVVSTDQAHIETSLNSAMMALAGDA